jgi:hypothetical protein
MMRNRILNYPIALVVVVGLAGILLGRHSTMNQAMGQSQQAKKAQQWEYCYVSSPYTYKTANNWQVNISYGGATQMADTDMTGVAALDKLGADGWELVSASDESVGQGQPSKTGFLLKRPKM